MSQFDTKILLVEDSIALQFVFEQQLKRLGYDLAAIVDNGAEAVDQVLTEPYNMVFMDVRLPGMDGITATEKIREVESETGLYTTIVGLTAFANRERCLESGMDDFLQKPVTLEQLSVVLEKWRGSPIVTTPAQQRVSTRKSVNAEERIKSIEEKISRLRGRYDLGI